MICRGKRQCKVYLKLVSEARCRAAAGNAMPRQFAAIFQRWSIIRHQRVIHGTHIVLHLRHVVRRGRDHTAHHLTRHTHSGHRLACEGDESQRNKPCHEASMKHKYVDIRLQLT